MSYNRQGGQQYGSGAYGSNPYQQQQPYGQNMEMSQYGQSQSYSGAQPQQGYSQDPNAVLNDCEEVSSGVRDIGQLLSQLQQAHTRALNDTTTDQNSRYNREIDLINNQIMDLYRGLTNKMKRIKSNPQAGNPRNTAQIGKVNRDLTSTYDRYRAVDNDFEKNMRAQMARQYRIVKPEASDQEVAEACEDPNQQIFHQALMNSDRRGQSRQVLSQVRDRHEAIQKIERQMEELAMLFNDMEQMVVEQDAKVEQIDNQAQDTLTNVEQGNAQLDKAEDSARAARRKKWICFWISIAILVIIIVVIVVAVVVTNNSK